MGSMDLFSFMAIISGDDKELVVRLHKRVFSNAAKPQSLVRFWTSSLVSQISLWTNSRK